MKKLLCILLLISLPSLVLGATLTILRGKVIISTRGRFTISQPAYSAPPAPPAFSPSDIAGMRLWLKADSLVLNDGDPLTSWTDSSGSGNSPYTINGMTYKTNILNGKPIVRLRSGSGQAYSSFYLVAPYTIFVVEDPHDGTNGNAKRTLTSTDVNSLISIGRSGLSCYTTGVCSSASVDTPSVVDLRAPTGSAVSFYLNGTDATYNGGTPPNGTDWGTVSLGSANPYSEYGDTDLAEVIIYNSALSASDRQAIEDYLGVKWGITISH
jgi:hypothetical protein